MSGIKNALPEYCHNCPYFGVHEAKNFSILTGLVAFYPSGIFKFKATMSEGTDEVFTMVTDFIVF